MKCEEIREDLAAYLDGEIEGASRRAVDDHLAGCAACSKERDALAATWRLLDIVPPTAVPAGFDERVLARVRAGGGMPRARILGLPLPAAAAAAAVILAAGGYVALKGRVGPGDTPPETLLSDLAVLEALDVLEDRDLEVVDRLDDIPEEELEVLGG